MSSSDIKEVPVKLPGSWIGFLYQKVLESCKSPMAVIWLGVLSFTESCMFIIPPETMLLPMCYANRKKAFYYAFITTVTSIMGAVAGYYIGMLLWNQIQPFFFEYIPGFSKHFDNVGELYKENVYTSLFLAAFTPIPFKVFTLAAGVYSAKISLGVLIGVCTLGRGLRYFLMAGLIYFFGDRAQELIEKHFKIFTIFMAVAAVGAGVFLFLRH